MVRVLQTSAESWGRKAGEISMDTMAWHPSGQGVEWAGCGAEPLCALGDRGVTALYTGVKPVHLWVCAAPAGWDQRTGDILPL